MMKPIPDWPDYFASDDGEIYSMKTSIETGNKPPLVPYKLKKALRPKYFSVILFKNGRIKNFKVAHLVLATFVSQRPIGLEIRHGTNGRFDDSLKNICWGTKAQNETDKIRDGMIMSGERNGFSKLRDYEVRFIRKNHSSMKGGLSMRKLAKMFGVDKRTISGVVNRKSWKHIK